MMLSYNTILMCVDKIEKDGHIVSVKDIDPTDIDDYGLVYENGYYSKINAEIFIKKGGYNPNMWQKLSAFLSKDNHSNLKWAISIIVTVILGLWVAMYKK